MKIFDTIKKQQKLKENFENKSLITHQELSVITSDYSIQQKQPLKLQVKNSNYTSFSEFDFKQQKHWTIYKNKILKILVNKSQDEYYKQKCPQLKTLSKTRSRLFDWFIEIVHSFKFSDETLIRSFKIFDQLYLNDKIALKQKELHFFGIGCLLIASKLHEKKQLSIKQAVKYLSFGQFTSDNLLDIEMKIFTEVQGQLFKTSLHDLNQYIICCVFDDFSHFQQFMQRTSQIMILMSLFSIKILQQFTQNQIVFYCNMLAIQMLKQQDEMYQAHIFEQKLKEKLQIKDKNLQKNLNFFKEYFLSFDCQYPWVKNLDKFYSFINQFQFKMEKFLRNEQIADLHQIRGDTLPLQSNTLYIAQRERLFCNLIESFDSSELPLQIKILQEIAVFFKNEQISTFAIKNSDMMHMLLVQVQNSNEQLEILAIVALERIMRYRIAKLQFSEKNGYQIILSKLDSVNDQVRYNAQKIIYNISKEQDLVEVLHKKNFIKYLIDLFAIEEIPLHQVLLNRLLSNFLHMNNIASVFLSYSIEDVLLEVSLSSTFDVLNSSLKNLLLLSYSQEGKKRLIEQKIYQKFFKIFAYFHEDFCSVEQPKIDHCDIDFIFKKIEMRELKQNVNKSFCSLIDFDIEDRMDDALFINFFASTSQSVVSKNFYAEFYAHELIINYLQYEKKEDSILLACVLFLTNISEHSDIRKDLQKHQNTLREIFYGMASEYQEFVEDMFEVINWKPQLIFDNFNIWKLINLLRYQIFMKSIINMQKLSIKSFNSFMQSIVRTSLFFNKDTILQGLKLHCFKKNFIHENDQIKQRRNEKYLQNFIDTNNNASLENLDKFKECLSKEQQKQQCYQKFQEIILNFEDQTKDLIRNKILQLTFFTKKISKLQDMLSKFFQVLFNSFQIMENYIFYHIYKKQNGY